MYALVVLTGAARSDAGLVGVSELRLPLRYEGRRTPCRVGDDAGVDHRRRELIAGEHFALFGGLDVGGGSPTASSRSSPQPSGTEGGPLHARWRVAKLVNDERLPFG